VAWRWHGRTRGAWPAGDLRDEIQRAASHAAQLQEAFSGYSDVESLDVSVSSTRPTRGRATEIHLDAVLVRRSAGRPVVLDHSELLMRKPDEASPWQQVLTAEEARHRMQAVLGSWAAEV
jgi:hypothetical protein